MTATTRRNLLAGGLGLGLSVRFLGAAAAHAGPLSQRKLIVIVCRGAMDGLSASPPIGDADYRALRGPLAIGDEALMLDGYFGLHPMLTAFHALARAGEARIVPAIASPDRARSHFEAQDVLESGSAQVYSSTTGWLNRAVGVMAADRRVAALAVGSTTPLLLRGPAESSTWSAGRGLPARARLPTLLQDLYRTDPELGRALARGLTTEAMAQSAMTGLPATAQGEPRAAARKMGATLAGFMLQDGGPQVASLSLDGFDTHAGQGAATGQLAQRLSYLDSVIDGIHRGMGDGWRDTVIVVCTEFGRTARVNGTSGTDHGTASTAMLAGGALKTGGIIGDWPTLKPTALFEDRDLAPTLDMRALFKGVLADHMGVPRKALDTTIFADSAAVKPVSGLIRV